MMNESMKLSRGDLYREARGARDRAYLDLSCVMMMMMMMMLKREIEGSIDGRDGFIGHLFAQELL